MRVLFIVVWLAGGTGLIRADRPSGVLPPPASKTIDFARDVQPIFQAHCHSCHGEKKQEAELRLDAKSVVLRGGAGGPVLVPGKSAESRMIQLVSGLDPDLVMPLKGERLSPEQVGILRAWIDQGAPWPEGVGAKVGDRRDHWAFQRPTTAAPPEVRQKRWVRNPIDHFILAALERENLKPSPEADKETLIRRLSLDLTGLPPTPEEIDQFLSDRSRHSYETLVDRLLNSPHYGERWGRHWLDLARYADTNGYEKDLPRSIWPYRDWVISAFNRDLPYNQFIIEQLAGDHLPNATLDQKVATGFLRNSMVNEEGGVDPEQFRVEGIIDRVDAIGKSFLGLTVACAQCHNHKYDPISQKEYYQFFAFLNNDDEPQIEYPTEEQIAGRREILARISKIEADLQKNDSRWRERQSDWEKAMVEMAGDWTPLDPESFYGSVGTKFTKLSDQSLLATASSPPISIYTVRVRTSLTNITGFRLEVMSDPNLPRGGPGRADNGNFVLSEFEVTAQPVNQPDQTNKLTFAAATADFSQGDYEAAKAIDGNDKSGWAIDAGPGRINQDRKIVFQSKERVGFPEGTLLTFSIKQVHGKEHTIGRFRLSATTQEGPVADPVPSSVRRLLSISPAQREALQQQAIFSVFRSFDTNFASANQQVEELMKQWPLASTTLILTEREEPRETRIFKRGDFRKPGTAVSAGVPAVLNPLPAGGPTNRMLLAKWLVDPAHPLTARVAVNRVWQTYFGQGLVTTPEDFGTRCDLPSHPELLDWLAVQFMEKGWGLKDLHRLITTSATYRQSSRVTPEGYSIDPFNRWLSRAPRLRVEAEIIRDLSLSVGGLLSRKIGGPSVHPPIPDGVLSLGYGAPMPWPTSEGEDRYRRAMYTFWKRSVPYPALLTFDAPNADFSCARRVRSNTPLQALVTLNDPLFVEAAKGMARRVLEDGGATEGLRIEHAFRLCVGRKPTKAEEQEVRSLLKDARNEFLSGKASPAALTSAPKEKAVVPPDGTALNDLAAWTVVSRVLLNLDETLTKD